ncbi:MAG TPA: hypothetical protein VMV82_08440 [Candidatus Dormibacteraeota bacterium]|nr:hypothetical protein [Candidatus Dormibacteraeota bacterium]
MEGALPTGATVTLRVRIAKAAAAGRSVLVLGSVYTDGYGVAYDGNGDVYLERWVRGARSVLGRIGHHANDARFHALTLTIAVRGASSNLLSAAFDGGAVDAQPLRDTSLSLTRGSFPVTAMTMYSKGSMRAYSVTLSSAAPPGRR